MQNILTKRRILAALLSAAQLYACIFVVNWLSLKDCSTHYFPPLIHCQWDLAAFVGSLFR